MTSAVWDLTSVDLCWWPGVNNAWESPRSTVSIPIIKAGLRAVSETILCKPTQQVKWTQQSTLTGEQIQRRKYSVASLLVRVLQSCLSCTIGQKCCWEIEGGGQSTSTAKEKMPSFPVHWNTQIKREAPSIARGGSGHQNTSWTPYPRSTDMSLWISSTHQEEDTRSKRNCGPAVCRKETTDTISQTKWSNKDTLLMKEEDKTYRVSKWREERQSTIKITQNNDSKNDPRLQKKDEGMN